MDEKKEPDFEIAVCFHFCSTKNLCQMHLFRTQTTNQIGISKDQFRLLRNPVQVRTFFTGVLSTINLRITKVRAPFLRESKSYQHESKDRLRPRRHRFLRFRPERP